MNSKWKNILLRLILPLAIFGGLVFIANHYYGDIGIGVLIGIVWGGGAIYLHIKKRETKKEIRSKMHEDLTSLQILYLLREAYNTDKESYLVHQLMSKLEVSIKGNIK